MKRIVIYSLILISFVANAQEKDGNLPKGNEAFAQKKYADAEADFRISQSKIPFTDKIKRENQNTNLRKL